MNETLDSAVARFGATAKDKLANLGAVGQPEDQLRAPFERLLADIADLSHFATGTVTAVGESSQSELNGRDWKDATAVGWVYEYALVDTTGQYPTRWPNTPTLSVRWNGCIAN
jgi:hypothetical protein